MSLWEPPGAPTPEDDDRGDRRVRDVRHHGARVVVAVALALLTYALFPASPAVDFPLLEVGSVAPDNVISPFAFTVRKPAAELARERGDAVQSVEPVFVYTPAALDSSLLQLSAFARVMDDAAANAPAPEATKVSALVRAAASRGVMLSPAEAAYLASAPRRRELVTAVERVFQRGASGGVASSAALSDVRAGVTVRRDDAERSLPVDSIPTLADLVARARRSHPDPSSAVGDAAYVKLIGAFFHPTLAFDRVATESRRLTLSRTITDRKYDVRAGEKIVGAHEVVGREEHEKMRALRDDLESRRGAQRALGRVAGAVLFNALVIAVLGLTLRLFRPALYASIRSVAFVAGAYLIVIVAASVLSRAETMHAELIPVAFAAVLIGVLVDARIALVAAMILATLIGGQSAFRGTNALFVNLIGGVAAAFGARSIRRRTDALRPILFVAGGYLLAAVAIGLTLDWSIIEVARSAGWGAANAVTSVALALMVLPYAEELTGIDTYPKLLEWSDLNRPLMQRLSLEAPGTYNHTIVMASLAEAACNAIGANGLLARVGAYYHDIGKLKKPQYFVENQAKGRNPHDKLKPTTSASIIRNHVREGLELAEEAGVPRAVRAFIAEHHGTGSISYFLEKARERDGAAAANVGEFTYPGPTPQSAETAVCMLADGAEAAVRVLADPTPQKIRDVVDHIVRQRTEQGQLRDAPLTLRQLEIVKQQFTRMLVAQHHSRIDYPAASGGVTAEFVAL